jgi:hypothetical protein
MTILPRKPPIGALLTLAGAAAAIVGSFMPWAHVTIVRNPLVGATVSLNPDGWKGDGNVVFGIGVAAAVVGVALLLKDEERTGSVLRTIVLLLGIGVLGVTFWDTTHVAQRFSPVARQVAQDLRLNRVAPRVRTRVASGIVLAALGGAVLVVAAVVDRFVVDEELVIEED